MEPLICATVIIAAYHFPMFTLLTVTVFVSSMHVGAISVGFSLNITKISSGSGRSG